MGKRIIQIIVVLFGISFLTFGLMYLAPGDPARAMYASAGSIPDEEVIEYIMQGFDASEIARAMHSDINLVALKVSDLSRRGYAFHTPEHRKNFLPAVQKRELLRRKLILRRQNIIRQHTGKKSGIIVTSR